MDLEPEGPAVRITLPLILLLAALASAACFPSDAPELQDGEPTSMVMDRMAELDGAEVSVASVRALLHRCVEIAFDGNLQEQYLGDGVWRVYPIVGEWTREWRVYERSLTVSTCFVPDTGERVE